MWLTKYSASKTALVLLFLCLSGCSLLFPERYSSRHQSLHIDTVVREGSEFLEVRAAFEVSTPPTKVLRFLSTTANVTDWMEYADRVTVLQYYDHNHFLIQTILKSPWPFQSRELVSCVDTAFTREKIAIDIRNCAAKHPLSDGVVRVADLASRWTLVKLDSGATRVVYSAWVEPGGMVPAFVFNSQLRRTTELSLGRLIESLSASD